jgi:hypothetical protein
MEAACTHGSISVITSRGDITSGLCSECGSLVKLDVMIQPDGKCFWFEPGSIDQRTSSHPANIGWIEVAPGVWAHRP